MVLGPDLAQGADELLGAAIAFVVLQPGFTEGGELALEPAADDVDREASVRQVVGGGPEFGEDARVPQSRVDGGDDLQALGGEQQGEAEAGRLVLELGAVAGHVTDLAERVVEAVVLGEYGQFAVVVVTPVGALLDPAGDQAATDVGNPVREFHGIHGVQRIHGIQGIHGRCGHAELLLRISGTPNSQGAFRTAHGIAEFRRCGENAAHGCPTTAVGPMGCGGSGDSGRGATGGAGDAREVDMASPREVQSHHHAVDRGSRPRGQSRKTRPVSYRGPPNFTNV